MRAGTIPALLDEADGGAGRRFLVFPDIRSGNWQVASRVAHVGRIPAPHRYSVTETRHLLSLNSQAKISLVGLEKASNLLCAFRCLI